MVPGIENHVDWTAAATPAGDRSGKGRDRGHRPDTATTASRSVVDTLLGQNDLAAYDSSGGDPYNATGKHFRR